MKMKLMSLGLTLTLSVISLSGTAKTITFKPMNDTLATKACYIAAEEGLSAARAMVKKESVNFNEFKLVVSCNGISLTKFANKYQDERTVDSSVERTVDSSVESKVENNSTIKLVAKNNNPASMVCLDALVIGEQQAREKYDIKFESIICNNSEIKTFLRKYQQQNLIVRNSVE
jgi:hypothetical protein